MNFDQTLIFADSLVKHFGELTAVNNISLKVCAGELLALLGPNGAGKTTLARMICGLLKPDSGNVRIKNRDVRTDLGFLKRHLGYCPQRTIIWEDLTCRQQLCLMASMYGLSKEVSSHRAQKLLELLTLTEKTDELALNLSGGMQRRLSIALSMIHEPEVLILDEPEAGLDPHSRAMVRTALRKQVLEGKRGLIVSTHDMAEAERLADKVAIIDRGILLDHGSPQEIIKRHGTTNLLEVLLSENDAGKAKELTGELEKLASKVVFVGNTMTMDTDRGETTFEPLRKILAQRHIAPLELRYRRRTLEDVFLEMTGRGLNE